eukprot:GGOE01001627.1.p1 GENE.GGOE01001627.1~~GGOE01001627.1.p1  ORF type:complete len:610 (+),score=134.32 GGOE01001627.1:261-1832(+)
MDATQGAGSLLRGALHVPASDEKAPPPPSPSPPQESPRGHGGSHPGHAAPSTEQTTAQRREAVREAFRHAWSGYKTAAWSHDELRPVTNRTNDSWGGFGVTLVDALDTLWIMGLKQEWEESLGVVRQLDYDQDVTVSVFETTIRHLGGLLGAYTLSKEPVLLQKATQLGKLLLPAFSTKFGIPYHKMNLRTKQGGFPEWTGHCALLAEAGSVQLEWKYLSQVTGDPQFHDAAHRFMQLLDDMDATQFEGVSGSPKVPRWGHWDFEHAVRGLWPLWVHPETGKFTNNVLSFGGMADSFYEYLLKQFLLSGRADQSARRLYRHAIDGLRSKLLQRSQPGSFLFVAQLKEGALDPTMEHLSCFLPGVLALGADHTDAAHLWLAAKLLDTCYALYERSPLGLSPEAVVFNTQKGKAQDWQTISPKYLLRPEVAESLFILWRKTKNDHYRDRAWQIFQRIAQHCRTPLAYSGLEDVTEVPPKWNDSMQSFFLAETLKYLFLIFSPDDVLPLDKFVLSTEAHPFAIPGT